MNAKQTLDRAKKVTRSAVPVTAKQKLLSLAEKYELRMDMDAPFDSIEIGAPEGMRFDSELHFLVTQRDNENNETKESQYRRVIRDIETYAPKMTICPSDCPCRE